MTPSLPVLPLAVYLGNGLSGAPAQLPAYEKFVGAPAGSVMMLDYGGGENATDPLTNYGWPSWTAAPFIAAGRRMILGSAGIPLPGQTWASVTGNAIHKSAYVAFWTAYAQQCAANNVDTVRFAHENDGDWFHWGARNQGPAFQAAAAVWVGVMRQYAPKVKLAINPTCDAAGLLDYYFGNIIGLFDIVGVDVYPWQNLVNGNTSAMTDTQRQHVWAGRQAQLITIHAWAKAHGKPIFYYEVGLREWDGNGTGDDAIWVNSFFAFIAAQGYGTGPGQVCGIAWWEDPTGGGRGFFMHCIPVPKATAAFLANIQKAAPTPTPVPDAGPVITNPTGTTADATVGTALDAGWTPVTATGTGPFTWSTHNLPPGLAVDPNTGAWSGTPTQAGTYLTTFTVTDGKGRTATSQVVTFTIKPDPNAPATTDRGPAVASAVRAALTGMGV